MEATTAKVVPLPVIRRPDTGEAVRMAQKILIYNAYVSPPADGIFGPNTENATKKYQQERGLVADGIIGPKTWQKLTNEPPIG